MSPSGGLYGRKKENNKRRKNGDINHGRNYKETAAKYGCSYSQVYSWVRKYESQGTDGLNDNRGHHKAEEDLTDNEKLEREIRRLKEELRRKEIEVKFLKKLNELGRGR